MWSSWPWVTKRPGDPVVVERAEVGVDDVDPEAAVVERDPAVDDERLAALLEGEAVHADFAEAAEDEDTQGHAP